MAKHTDVRDASQALNRRAALKIGAGGVAFAAATRVLPAAAQAPARASSLGIYSGYASEAYDGWVRTAQYVPARDGTRLAVDVFRPTKAKVLHKEKLPVVWLLKRYQRATVQPDGSTISALHSAGPLQSAGWWSQTAQRLIKHGYIIACADRRGTGASFGTRSEFSDPLDGLDGHDINEWLAAQPWCSGKTGMYGASYEGEIQLRVAATAPPHLKAIMPEVSPFDWYQIVHHGGIYRTFFADFQKMVSGMDANPNNGPVDSDKDQALRNAAIAEHKAKNDYSATFGKLPYRDSKNPATGEQNWLRRHGGNYGPGLTSSGVASYHRVGWFAGVMVEQLCWYANQKNTAKKMLVGPWGAGGAVTAEDWAMWTVEAHRWFDYWLKGVQNGIMDEDPISSSPAVAHTRNGAPFRGLKQWPLANEQRTEFFFEAGRAGASQSVNDGKLTRAKPRAKKAADLYTVRYDCAYKGGAEPARGGQKAVDHADFDAQGLTYTSEPLAADQEVTGHPVIRLWVSSTADDGDFFVKLEDVDPSGASTFATHGTLRASHRALGDAPYEFLGLPWTSSREADKRPLVKDEPAELTFALLPMSYIFKRGHRFRVTVTCSDTDIASPSVVSPAPVVSLHRAATRASSITLPIIPAA